MNLMNMAKNVKKLHTQAARRLKNTAPNEAQP